MPDVWTKHPDIVRNLLQEAAPAPFAGSGAIAEASAWTVPALGLVLAAGITRWRAGRGQRR